MNDQKLIKNLSKLFTNKKFLATIVKSDKNFNIKESYGNVLKYYICTRDKNFDQTYDQIMEKLYKINEGNFEELGLTYEQILLNSRENGFITSAQNGNKSYRIKKYGLDYFDKLNENEKKELIEARNALKQLENFFGKSQYIKIDEKEKNPQAARQYFFSTPGPKSIHYALSASPERLYLGPLAGIESFPIIYGEPKKEYYFRFVKDKISRLGLENLSDEIMKCMEKVFETYCKNPPIIMMISNKQAFNIKFFHSVIKDHNSETLKDIFNQQGFNYINTYFSENPDDSSEHNNAGNLVTVVDQIPENAVNGYITMLDTYEIYQIIGKEKGAKVGDIITREANSVIENNDLLTLATSLKYVNSNENLEYLTKKIHSILDENLPFLKEKYGDISQIELENRIKELKEKREEILNRDFAKKDSIEPTITLRQIVHQLEQEDRYNQLLDDDENIKKDEIQYRSLLHGINHTRRVNFFANVIIIQNKGTLDKQKDVILAAVKNHDIGRTHDGEDKEHGFNSITILSEHPERLEKFNDEEKKQILFAIREHSLSKKENESDLDKLLREELTQQQVYDFKNIMYVLKNADKLDRVRLDPYGENLKEGLDIDRFVGEDSLIKTLQDMEYLAYESLEKVLELLDTDRELRNLEKYLYLKKGAQKYKENISCAKSNIVNTEKNKKAIVSSIDVGGLSQINKVLKTFKDKFKGLFQKRDGTGRKNE